MGTDLNRNRGTIKHKLKGSIGTGGSKSPTGPARGDVRDVAYLANATVPKYTAINLFLRVNAYTLR